jgi:hypothetical protein
MRSHASMRVCVRRDALSMEAQPRRVEPVEQVHIRAGENREQLLVADARGHWGFVCCVTVVNTSPTGLYFNPIIT